MWNDLENMYVKARRPYSPPRQYKTPEEKLITAIRKYLKDSSPDKLQKIVNDLIAENVIDA